MGKIIKALAIAPLVPVIVFTSLISANLQSKLLYLLPASFIGSAIYIAKN
jgi:hypothetical protein